MSVAALQAEEILNMVRPNRYFAAWREGGKVEYAVVEPGEALMALPGMSVRVVGVRAKPLDGVQPPQDIMSHARVKWLSDVVGYPPALKVYQYTFTPLKTQLIQRLETGAEFYAVMQEQDAPSITVHTVNAYYVVYRSNSGRLYSEVKGGIKAYQLVRRGQLQRPQVYVMQLDKHRTEIGVRAPLDVEQVKQLISYLAGL
jgi:hypothetical protein